LLAACAALCLCGAQRTRADERGSEATLAAGWAPDGVAGGAGRARALPVDKDETPPRYLAALSLGMPLRLAPDSKYGQKAFAPAFTDALGGYVFPGRTRFQHGVGLGFSTNLQTDGGYTEPVAALSQLVAMPAYLLYWNARPELFALGHVGLPIAVRGSASAGIEIACTLGYRLLAGFGTFAEAGLDVFVAAGSTLSPMFSLKAGLFLDYEVLP
jgi:hypothetical protein